MSFKSKNESVQYGACIKVTGAIQETPWERLYCEVRSESSNERCWIRELGFFIKL